MHTGSTALAIQLAERDAELVRLRSYRDGLVVINRTLETENERLRTALRRARQDINDYGLDDFEETTHETLAVIDAALGPIQG